MSCGDRQARRFRDRWIPVPCGCLGTTLLSSLPTNKRPGGCLILADVEGRGFRGSSRARFWRSVALLSTVSNSATRFVSGCSGIYSCFSLAGRHFKVSSAMLSYRGHRGATSNNRNTCACVPLRKYLRNGKPIPLLYHHYFSIRQLFSIFRILSATLHNVGLLVKKQQSLRM